MGLFTQKEKDYLASQRVGRLATVGKTAQPHVIPVGFHLDTDSESIKIGGHSYRGQARLYIRHLQSNPQAAFVVDDVVTEPQWAPRGVLIKGPVRIHDTGGEALGPGFGPRWIEITPQWVNSWGINADPFAEPSAPRKATDT
ncbi:PPOX class F420-dependent oxidoreductase [Mycobacterium sp. TNTM28]|uniref:PPOX class F420-dependent oxidoreductase n=1 Tax=[Mycobacterium] fortunisiensis TaxID=2600579 RepID=A0ABS6KG74_9MYCO|nr:PPOX class F420-dependent oxidoreductase [[Mycobacterium] fortunisiensis]MBU9762540.1 PPOX class F420-dependent oxidoreductase [[Mycobacterium] fortunisiensis]